MNTEEMIEQAEHAYQNKDYKISFSLLKQAVKLAPKNTVALTNLCYLAYVNGDLKLALSTGEQSVSLQPDNIDAITNYASALRTNGQINEAIHLLERAIGINPNSAITLTHLNLAYMDAGQINDALAAGNKALQKDPKLVNAYNNLAITYQQIGDSRMADSLLQKAMLIAPATEFIHKNLLMNTQYLPALSSRRSLSDAQTYGDILENELPGLVCTTKHNSAVNASPIKIGYLGGDFRKHPVGWFLQSLLQAHDNAHFHIYIYANQQINDEMTDEIKSHCTQWRDILQLSDQEAVDLIRNDQIDILVDLAGHTGGSRLNVFAKRGAPIQISWLGYFASTGVKTIDYVMLGQDQVVDGSQSFFTEKLYPLNGGQFCYRPPDYAPDVSPPPSQKKPYITFGSFNNTAKLNEDVIRCWAAILHACERSRLLLKWSVFKDEDICQMFLKRFKKYGIRSERIELRGPSSHVEMLAQYADIDIALDPFPFSGALTSCEALWMGVPVISLPQLRPVSRQTLGILNSLDLNDLSATTTGQYITLALELANNHQRLTNLRATLRQRIANSDLIDGEKMARHIENAYREIYSLSCRK